MSRKHFLGIRKYICECSHLGTHSVEQVNDLVGNTKHDPGLPFQISPAMSDQSFVVDLLGY